MNTKKIKTFLFLLFNLSIINAQENNGLAFLKVDVDARAASMAGAYTALSKDGSAAYWNPAGLALAEKKSLIVMHNNWLWDFTHSFAACHFLIGEHNFALSFNYMQIPGIEPRLTPTEEPSGTIDAYNLAAGLSYAKMYDEEWAAGISLKYLFEKYYFFSAPGWAIDMGVYKKNLLSYTDIGFTIQNIGKMSGLNKKSSPLPIIVSSDLSIRVPGFFDNKLIVSPGFRWISKEKTYFHIGTEYQLYGNLHLRAGLRNGNDSIMWTGGLGVNYKSFHLDYAYAPFEYELGSSGRVSLGIAL